ncbi:MAG TPA: uracil phosphoribosyltransferase [Woeseiaceae bacterium]|nr:uracil phosphoribosyltransferase [Woeseiaceae bacterium]
MHEEVRHPCVQHKLSLIRDRRTGHQEFRALAREITMFVCYEALKAVNVREVVVETPLAEAQGFRIDEDLIVVPILRAGVGMLEGILDLVPTARVGFIGMYRDKVTKKPVAYYDRLPTGLQNALHIVIDPMIATGGSTAAAIDILKQNGASRIVVACIVTCPEGLSTIEAAHPDVSLYTASIDARLDERKYIVPGLGDAGDRLFGTS